MQATYRPPLRPIAIMALLFASGYATATENGPTTPFGVYDFGAGMLPPASDYGTVGVRASYYTSDRNNNNSGQPSLNNFKLTVATVGVAYIHMTNQDLLGGKYGFGAVMPFMDIRGHGDVPNAPVHLQSSTFDQADLQLYPLMIQWQRGSSFINASLQIQAPTGEYDKNRAFNPGTNHWSVGPTVGFTHITPGGLEVSSNVELDFNSPNPDTHYRSGTEFKHEFAIGQHVGAYTLGLGGYWYRQLTDDTGPTAAANGNRARVMALGPAISFFQPGLPGVWFHFYKEFEARNRSTGYATAIRIAKSF